MFAHLSNNYSSDANGTIWISEQAESDGYGYNVDMTNGGDTNMGGRINAEAEENLLKEVVKEDKVKNICIKDMMDRKWKWMMVKGNQGMQKIGKALKRGFVCGKHCL